MITTALDSIFTLSTVSISTYFSYKNTVNWHFFFVYRKFYHPSCIRHFFLYFLIRVTHISEQTRQDSSHGLKHQTAVSRFLRCSFSELRLKNKYWFVVEKQCCSRLKYFLYFEDFPSMFKFILSPLPALCCILRQFNSHTVFRKNCLSEILILEATGTAVSQL